MTLTEIRLALNGEPPHAGVGNTSQLMLLASAQALDRASRPDGGLAGAPGGSEVILLVEDEAPIRALVRTILEIKGYVVCEACNGREGLDLCGTHQGPIHMLLSDVNMPELSGYELADGARKLRPGMRVMFMSGYAEKVPLKDEDSHGSAFLQKPFTPFALVSKVRETLDGTCSAA